MIIPAILRENLKDIQKELGLVSSFAPLVQIDLNDGKLFEGKSYLDLENILKITKEIPERVSLLRGIPEQSDIVKRNRKTPFFLDLHLMIKDPFPYLKPRTNQIRQISAHAESSANLKDWLKKAKQKGWKAGISLAPKTSWREIEPLIPLADFIQFLTVTPGLQGQSFQPKVLPEIKALHKKYPNKIIQVDGGEKKENIKDVLKAGANNVVIGSAIIKSKCPEKTYKKFTEIAKRYE